MGFTGREKGLATRARPHGGAAGGITGMKSCGLKGWLRDDADGRRVGGASRRGGGGLGDRARKEMKRSALPSWEGSGKTVPREIPAAPQICVHVPGPGLPGNLIGAVCGASFKNVRA